MAVRNLVLLASCALALWSGAAARAESLADSLVRGPYRWALVKLYGATALYSAFLNNTPLVLLGAPVVKDVDPVVRQG